LEFGQQARSPIGRKPLIQELGKIRFGQFGVFNDLYQEPRSNILASMRRDDRHSSVGMPHYDMAPLLTDLQETRLSQGFDDLPCGDWFH
jgi:hypothetical protein